LSYFVLFSGIFGVFLNVEICVFHETNARFARYSPVTASSETQRLRVLRRPNMTPEKFEAIKSKQLPDEEKRMKADFVVHTDFPGYAPAKAQVSRIIETIIEAHPLRWTAWKSRTLVQSSKSSNSYDSAAISIDSTPTSSSSSSILTSSSTSVISSSASSSLKLKEILKSSFDAIIFDLDDTLVPVDKPITKANDELFKFMIDKMPLTSQIVKKRLREVMSRVTKDNPLLAHDLTEVRKEALRALVSESMASSEMDHVEEAMDLFVNARSDVLPHLYDDVLPCLELFSQCGIKMGVLTNGNANLTSCPVLGKYISITLSAGDVGAMKPSPTPFLAILQRMDCLPSRTLYVGDSFEKDVLGAKNAGIKTAYLQRLEDSEGDRSGNASVSDIILKSLHPSEIEEKFISFLNAKIENT